MNVVLDFSINLPGCFWLSNEFPNPTVLPFEEPESYNAYSGVCIQFFSPSSLCGHTHLSKESCIQILCVNQFKNLGNILLNVKYLLFKL